MAEIKYLDLTGLQRYDQKIKEVVNTGLDAKIGKDDVMLGSEDLLSSWEGNDVPETPYMTNNWSASIKWIGGVYIPTTIYNENNEVIFELPSAEELDTANFPVLSYTYTHNNGNLSILVELMDAPENYTANVQINPTSAYKLVFGEDVYHVRLTGDIYTELPTNTKKSFEKLNKSIVSFDSKIRELEENKADKSDIKEILLGERDLGDSVIFHDSDSVKDGQGVTGSIPLESGYVYFSTISEFDASDASYDKKLIGIVAGFDSKANSWDIPTAVSQLSNDAGYAVAGDLKIAEVTEGLGENVAKAYKFEGGAESAVIEIPKDQTLKSVELGKIVDDTFVVDPTGEILRFTYIITDGSEKVVDVNVSNLITEAELNPVYDLIDTKLNAADVLTVSNDEIDAMFA